jgi:sulfate transport system ATP-binding protein
MNRGRIEQVGTTDEVYERPATPFVFDFLGSVNLLPGTVQGRKLSINGTTLTLESNNIHPAGEVDIYVRPHDLRVVEESSPGLDAVVRTIQRTGAIVRLVAQLDHSEESIEVELSHLDPFALKRKAGDKIRLLPVSYGLFPRAPHDKPQTLPDVVANAPAEYRERGRLG